MYFQKNPATNIATVLTEAILIKACRSFSSDATSSRRGAGLMERLSSFFVGAGLTALATQFYIFHEIKDGNDAMIKKQKDLEKRVAKLEG